MINKLKSLIYKFYTNSLKKNTKKLTKVKDYLDSINDEIVKNSDFNPLLPRLGVRYKTHNIKYDIFGNIVFNTNIRFVISLLLFIFTFFTYGIFLSAKYDLKNYKFLKSFTWSNYKGRYENYMLTDYFNSYLKLTEDQIFIINQMLYPLFILIIFILTVFLIIYIFKDPLLSELSLIFNFKNGYFYDKKYQKKLFNLIKNPDYKNKIIPISEIHALQIIEKKAYDLRNGSFKCYELNMILKDSSRVNIVNHGFIKDIQKNAIVLAEKLKIQIYDLTNI